MTFGLQPEEIEVLVREVIEESGKGYPVGAHLESAQPLQVTRAITEAITKNNARIFKALTKAEIKL